MFDAVPPNLPVEPTPGAPITPPTMPTASAPMMPQVTGQTRKEPEDIFKGLEMSGEAPVGAAAMPEILEAGPKRNWLMIIGIAIAGLIVLGGIGFGLWYMMLGRQTEPAEEAPTAVTTTQPKEIVEQPPIMPEQPVTTPPPGTSIPTPELPTQPEAQPVTESATPTQPLVEVVPTEGLDTDADGLTDVEEALFGTSLSELDTNANTYPDGTEVRNLYDPLKKGMPLADSAQLTWTNFETFRYLLPKGWNMASDPNGPQSVIIDTGTLAKVLLADRPNPNRLPLNEWLAIPVGDTGMKQIKLKSGLTGYQTPDGLTTYLDIDGTIISVVYDLNGAATYDFRAVYDMVLNSFQKAPVK